MHVRVPKLVPNYSGQKISSHHSNLRTKFRFEKEEQVLTALDQVTILDFQLGPDLNDEQFLRPPYFGLGNLICNLL